MGRDQANEIYLQTAHTKHAADPELLGQGQSERENDRDRNEDQHHIADGVGDGRGEIEAGPVDAVAGGDAHIPVLGKGAASEDQTQGDGNGVSCNDEGDQVNEVFPDSDHVGQSIVEHQEGKLGGGQGREVDDRAREDGLQMEAALLSD